MRNIKAAATSILAMVAFQAHAQNTARPAAASAAENESDIVVTALKREQSLQDVSLAITAIGQKTLESGNVSRLDGIQTLVPSLQIGQTQAYFFTSIRGVGDTNFSIVSDPAVPFYVDGLYYPRANGPNAVMFDVGRVEVLRGPQGTLYGRNATGGVVNVIPNQPGRAFGGEGAVQYGNYNDIRVTGAVDVPLADNLHARVAGIYSNREGYTRNLATTPDADKTIDRVNDVGLRGIVRYEPTDAITLRLVSSYYHGTGGSIPQKYIGPNPTTPAYAGAPENPTDPRLLYNDGISKVDLEDFTLFGEAVIDLGGVDWTTQVGYLNQSAHRMADIDGSDRFIQNSEALVKTEMVTVESRIAGETGPLRYLAGVFYLNEDALNEIRAGAPAGPFLRINTARNRSIAAFGELTYSLTDAWRVTGGLRYTRDEKTGLSRTLLQPGTPPPANPAPRDSALEFDRVTWRVNTELDVTDNHLLYATVSSGYKAGGFNFVEGTTYRPEQLTAYEIGARNTFDNLTLNFSAFYYDYKDLQLNQLVPPIPPATVGTVQVSNAASTRTYGAEVEFNWTPVQRLNISGFVTWLDAKFREFSNDDSSIPGTLVENLAGKTPAFSPEWAASLTVSYGIEVGGGYFLTPRVTEYWRDKSFLREFNRGVEIVPSYFRTDASIELAAPGRRWSITAYVNNLEDNNILNYVAVGSPTVGYRFAGTYNPPRTYGVRLNTRF